MAKKKDKTGLAGIVKNVPRKVDIKGQPHMLAWITPKEGETLQALGGSGTPGPMGIPAYYDPGGTADPGQAAEGGFSDSFGGYDGPDNSDNDRGYRDGTTDTRPGTGTTDEDEDQSLEQDKALADFLSGKEDRNWVEQMMIDKVKKGEELYSYEYDPDRNRYTGFEEKAKPGFGGLSNILAMLSENIFGVTPTTYTGFGKKAGFNDIIFNDGGRDIVNKDIGKTDVIKAEEPDYGISSPDSYYASGIGAATLDLNDPVQRELYFRRLYGETPSPIGREYKSAFNLKDLKNRKRMRGLDIFKPVSVV